MIAPNRNAKSILGESVMADEQWRPIPGYEGFYDVSNIGRVRSKTRSIIRIDGTPLTTQGRILKPGVEKSGHLRFFASTGHGKTKRVAIHRAVLAAFAGPCPQGCEVRHLDGNPANNLLENLSYGTRAENIADAKRHGTFPIHKKRPGAKLTEADAIAIASSHESPGYLASQYGVVVGVIRQIRVGDTWGDVTIDAREKNPYCPKYRQLTEDQINEIRLSPLKRKDLAEKFGVSEHVIKRARRSNRKSI